MLADLAGADALPVAERLRAGGSGPCLRGVASGVQQRRFPAVPSACGMPGRRRAGTVRVVLSAYSSRIQRGLEWRSESAGADFPQ